MESGGVLSFVAFTLSFAFPHFVYLQLEVCNAFDLCPTAFRLFLCGHTESYQAYHFAPPRELIQVAWTTAWFHVTVKETSHVCKFRSDSISLFWCLMMWVGVARNTRKGSKVWIHIHVKLFIHKDPFSISKRKKTSKLHYKLSIVSH